MKPGHPHKYTGFRAGLFMRPTETLASGSILMGAAHCCLHCFSFSLHSAEEADREDDGMWSRGKRGARVLGGAPPGKGGSIWPAASSVRSSCTSPDWRAQDLLIRCANLLPYL